MGGSITGPLLDMQQIGSLLFLLASLFCFVFRRIAAGTALLACFACLPMYFYFTAPGPFRWVFPGNYKAPLQASFVCEWWSIGGIIAVSLTALNSIRAFRNARIGKC
jgi:hypothetical protein